MEARLVDSLHARLRQHEQSMQATRRQLLADFQRYYDDVLRGASPAVAASVRTAITASFARSRYPALRPELQPLDSPRPEAPSPAAFQLPLLPAAPGAPDDARGACDRDRELGGLFMPTYLPLLEASPTAARPAAAAGVLARPASAVPPSPPPPPPAMHLRQAAAAAALVTAAEGPDGHDARGAGHVASAPARPLTPVDLFSVSAWPVSGPADDTHSSTPSDKSDSKPTKSALRRSSSMPKSPQSPRRVRFEFMGAEVLPTSSPHRSDLVAIHSSSAESDDDSTGFDSNLGGQIGDEDDQGRAAPPRKVSSSDALRALSRAPLDQGTLWTVVNPDVDDAALYELQSGPATLATGPSQEHDSPPPAPTSPEDAGHEMEPFAYSEYEAEREPLLENSDDDDSSDDGFLSMAKTRTTKTLPRPASPRSPTTPAHANSNSARQPQRQSTNPTPSETVTDEDDADNADLFFFEAGGLSAPPKPRPRQPPHDTGGDEAAEAETDGQNEAKDGDASDATAAQPSDTLTSLYATSPAVPIRHASRPSTSVRFQPGSLGSYKGRPVMMPIVRDPELLAEATLMAEPRLREGGIDDETAMEDGSPPRFPSTPLSFKERFIMEEMMATGRARPKRTGLQGAKVRDNV